MNQVFEQTDAALAAVDALATAYDPEDYRRAAGETDIDPVALAHLDASQPFIPYPYYFCLPETLAARPDLIFYYRKMALLSADEMRAIGLDTQPYERGLTAPDRETALELARCFNRITGGLILSGGCAPYRHVQLLTAAPA